jgi:hypothetical protein
MKNRLKSNVLTAGIVIALFFLVIGFFLIPFHSDQALQISFLNYTNDAALGKLAVFAVTNVSNEKISFGLYQPQVKTSGQWSKLAYRSYVSGFPPIIIDLSPHNAATFINIAVTNGNVWRVPVDWCYATPHPIESSLGNLEENIYWNSKFLLEGKPLRFSSGAWIKGYITYSSELTNK